MAPDVSGLIEGLPAALLALRGLAERRRPGDRSGPHPLALSTYMKFQKAGMEILTAYRMLPAIGVPPKLLGGAYTWPAVMRLHRLLMEASSDLTVAFGEMAMFGTFEAVKAAATFAEALAVVPSKLKPSGGQTIRLGQHSYTFNERITMSADIATAVDAATLALRDYIATVRAEMDLPELARDQGSGGTPDPVE